MTQVHNKSDKFFKFIIKKNYLSLFLLKLEVCIFEYYKQVTYIFKCKKM